MEIMSIFITLFFISLSSMIFPSPSAASSQHLISLKCKVHILQQCNRFCNVCESENLNVTMENTNLTEVIGYSVRNVAFHNNVVRLSINNQVCYFIPSNTQKFFPQMEVLRIWSSGLRRLEQHDISGLKYLRELILPINEIESLSSNLFEFNQQISKIDLSRNKLKNVGLAVFSPLKLLTHVQFNFNDCIDDNLKTNINEFINKVRQSCPPTMEMLSSDVVFLIEQNERLKITLEAKDEVIKNNCEFSLQRERHYEHEAGDEDNEEQIAYQLE